VNDIANALAETNYSAQGTLLKNDILETLRTIQRTQKESYTTPQEHIITYRENQVRMEAVREAVKELKGVAAEAGISQGLFGFIGGIQTFSTWGIIVAIVSGFALLAGIIFAMWRYQVKAIRILQRPGTKSALEESAHSTENSNGDDTATAETSSRHTSPPDDDERTPPQRMTSPRRRLGWGARILVFVVVIGGGLSLYGGWAHLKEGSRFTYTNGSHTSTRSSVPAEQADDAPDV